MTHIGGSRRQGTSGPAPAKGFISIGCIAFRSPTPAVNAASRPRAGPSQAVALP